MLFGRISEKHLAKFVRSQSSQSNQAVQNLTPIHLSRGAEKDALFSEIFCLAAKCEIIHCVNCEILLLRRNVK